MARTIRKRIHRNVDWDAPDSHYYTATGPEATCKPGCETCGKGERKRDNRRRRHSERKVIAEHLA